MSDIIKKFIYWFSKKQVKALRRDVKATSYANSTSKTVYTSSSSLKLTGKTEQNKTRLKNEVELILKKYKNNPDKLLEFIKNHKTPVYRIPKADKLLKVIGYDEGFIGKTTGVKAVYLNVITSLLSKQKLNFLAKTTEMFVLRDLPIDAYHMIQQFHKWYSMKLKLPGFDSLSQQNFQKFLYSSKDEELKALSIDEILGLKEAIARDVEAINFVVDLAKSSEGARRAMEKLKTGSATV